MNTCIETINDWGENFLTFAWPMFWQSSLLIVIVFAFDCVLSRNIRPAIRHALWLVVLVKLILPPTLALPTSATWWLWRAQPPIEAPVISHYTVVSDDASAPETFVPPPIPMMTPPPPHLERTGWLLLASATISLGLLIWVAMHWLNVLRKIHNASTSNSFNETIEKAWQSSGLRTHLPVKLIDDRLSPAVYGLFRPVILLPRLLAEKLSPAQLRAVLLHEAIHVRRGDVWVNCAQTLLQIAYWWHPLFWLANARIRRLREEAVDDAVMAALQSDAHTYAPTLLEVAKFAFRRPLASLGLVGIMESRSALRQRIERLVDFNPPRKVGMTFLALCGICVFSAIALPMGQGPAPTPAVATAQATDNKSPWPDPNFDGIRYVNLHAQFMILDESQLSTALPMLAGNREPVVIPVQDIPDFWKGLRHRGARVFGDGWEEGGIAQPPISGGDENYRIGGITNFTAVITALTTNAGGSFSNMLRGYDLHFPSSQPDWTPMTLKLRALMQDNDTFCSMDLSFPDETTQSTHSEAFIRDGDMMIWAVNPPNAPGKCQLVFLYPAEKQNADGVVSNPPENTAANMADAESGRDAIYRKLNQIRLTASYSNAPLSEVMYDLHKKSLHLDPDKSGINFLLNPNAENIFSTSSAIDPATGLPVKPAAAAPKVDLSPINISLTLTNVSLVTLLNAICMVANHPVQYSVENYGIVFSPKSPSLAVYQGQTFKVDADAFTHFISAQEKTDLISYILTHGPNAGDFGDDESVPFRPIVDYFKCLGVNIAPPKTLFYNDRSGLLYVYATPRDLGIIERFVTAFNDPSLAFLNATPLSDAAVRKLATNGWEQSGQVPGQSRRNAISSQLLNVVLDKFGPYNHAPVQQVFKDLDREAIASGADFKISFVYAPPATNEVLVSLPLLENVSLETVYDKILQGSNHPMEYSVTDLSVIFTTQNELEMRNFHVDTQAFIDAVRQQTGDPDVISGFKELASQAGVDFSPPKTIFLTHRMGVLSVQATPEDLDILEKILDSLHCLPQQIHIKARFIEVPHSFLANVHHVPAGITNGIGLLTAVTAKEFLKELQSVKGSEELAEPEATTLFGWQTQMRATVIMPIVTNYTYGAGSDGKFTVIPQIGRIETGPVLDVFPTPSSNNYTINLKVIPSLIEFLGYADPGKNPPHFATNDLGWKITLPGVLPMFQVREMTTQKSVYDGQSVVLFPEKGAVLFHTPDEKNGKSTREHLTAAGKNEKYMDLIVLVTATLIDPAGNRLHSDNDIPLAQTAVPHQAP